MNKHKPASGPDLFASFENIEDKFDEAAVMPVALDFCGSEQCAPGHGYGPNGPVIRTVYILHFILEGCGYLEKGGKRFKLGRGQAFLIYPGELTYYQADLKEPWWYIWIGFHGFQAEKIMARAGFLREAPYIHVEKIHEIRAFMQNIMENSELTYVKELKRMSALLGLFAVLCDACVDGCDPAGTDSSAAISRNTGRGYAHPRQHSIESDYVQTAVNLLTGARKTQIKVEDVAGSIGISRNYLDSIFKKRLGISPKEYLMNYRMEKASALLANTNNPIGVIAAEVGYSDAMTFSKIFHRRFGMSPTKFRESRHAEKILREI